MIAPVILIVYNRPDVTSKTFSRIAEARPAKLLVIADGPRPSRASDADLCRQVREIVSNVDWPCELFTNFAESNMGCKRRVLSGLDWAFEHVEEAIIIEDDILPHPSFFRFCTEMLERYRDDQRIGMVAGTNMDERPLVSGDSYYFSRLIHIWGWGTWRRSWKRIDPALRQWPEVQSQHFLRQLFTRRDEVAFWDRMFSDYYKGENNNAWSYGWVYANFFNSTLAVVPHINLIENTGFGMDATHPIKLASAPVMRAKPLSFPLVHPKSFVPLRSKDLRDGDASHFRDRSFINRAFCYLRRRLARLR